MCFGTPMFLASRSIQSPKAQDPQIHPSLIETLEQFRQDSIISHTIIMVEPTAADGGDGELEDEIWGNLRLRRSRSK